MRRLTKTVAALSLLSMMSVAAWALAQSSAKDDRAATMELMRTVVPPSAYEATIDQVYKQMSASMQQMGGAPIAAAQLKELKQAVKECMPYEELIGWSTDVYMKYFSRKEIDDLAAFYKTPTGKKVATNLPLITGEVGALMAPMMMNRMPTALKKHGFKI